MRKLTFTILFVSAVFLSRAQTAPSPRPLTMAEYGKAQTYAIADMDKDSYMKFDGAYILDRYQSRKPFFITGDDGMKKRIDLYKFIAKDGMQEIGLMVFYTTEKGIVYKALVPDYTADGKVWEKYFLDVDNINKVERNFALKLSYILSRELSFQQYKVLNGGKDMKEEAGTYGNDICFPGDNKVKMANGSVRLLKDIKKGDAVITINPATHLSAVVKVKELTVHEAKNYAITQLVLVSAKVKQINAGEDIQLSGKVLKATPNHPMLTKDGSRKAGEIKEGQEVLCLNEKTGQYEAFTVLQKTEHAGGLQKVYNMVADGGNTFLMNGVMVMQK